MANMVAQTGRERETITDACKLRGEGCVKQVTEPMALCVVMAMDRYRLVVCHAGHGEASAVCHDRGLWLPPGNADC